MKLLLASKKDVQDAEARVDAAFHAVALPGPSRSSANWHLLTVFEDGLRLAFWTAVRESPNVEAVIRSLLRNIDRFKYALRFGLDRIRLEARDANTETFKAETVPGRYKRAHELLQAGESYLLAARAFSSFYSNKATAFRNNEHTFLSIEPHRRSDVYSALHYHISGREQNTDQSPIPLSALVEAFVRPQNEGSIPAAIASTTTLAGERIQYETNAYLCNRLLMQLGKPESIVPSGWMFPWGKASQVEKVFEALQARCLYHFFAIHFGSIRLTLDGYGVADLCPLFELRTLLAEMEEIAGLDSSESFPVLNALTYGKMTDTPDPALQPLFCMSGTQIATSTILLLSSNFPRNSLALHARVDPTSFDRQSSSFEKSMSVRVEVLLKTYFSKYQMHKNLPGLSSVGEVDFLVADEASRSILLGELRWLLAPGDAREVMNRQKVCAEKVTQIRRKLEGAISVKDSILQAFGISDRDGWEVNGVVIVHGYAADGGESRRIPVVPLCIFELALKHCANISKLHRWLTSHEWLPVENVHFTSGKVTEKFGSQRLQWGGLHFNLTPVYFPDHVISSLRSFT